MKRDLSNALRVIAATLFALVVSACGPVQGSLGLHGARDIGPTGPTGHGAFLTAPRPSRDVDALN